MKTRQTLKLQNKMKNFFHLNQTNFFFFCAFTHFLFPFLSPRIREILTSSLRFSSFEYVHWGHVSLSALRSPNREIPVCADATSICTLTVFGKYVKEYWKKENKWKIESEREDEKQWIRKSLSENCQKFKISTQSFDSFEGFGTFKLW